MRKFLSYFYPVTTKYPSDFNGVLEVTWYQGRKMLNSANANYSYDSLQRVLKFGLNKIDSSGVNKILLLGLGGGSVVETLRNDYHFRGEITAIEIDKAVIEIASREFNITQSKNIDIIHTDAFNFISNTTLKFDLVIIDLFIDIHVPDTVYTTGFWDNIRSCLNEGGCFIFNAAVKQNDASKIRLAEQGFHVNRFDLVEGSNTLFVGKVK